MSISVRPVGDRIEVDVVDVLDAPRARRLAQELLQAADLVDPPPDEEYDDAKDHTPCPGCAHTQTPGRDVVTPSLPCPDCDGAGWI